MIFVAVLEGPDAERARPLLASTDGEVVGVVLAALAERMAAAGPGVGTGPARPPLRFVPRERPEATLPSRPAS